MPLPDPYLVPDDFLLPAGTDAGYVLELYQQIRHLHGDDPDLLALDLVEAWAFGATEVNELVRETAAGSAWSLIFDVDLVWTKGLPWLAQMRGVKLPARRVADQSEYAYDQACRKLIRDASARERGTPGALRAAIETTLTGSAPYVKITERQGNNAYRVAVRTLTAETPSTTVTQAAAQSQVPGGVVLDYAAVAEQSWAAVTGAFVDWAAATAAYPTWGDMVANLP